jgi:hypothetical protein
MVRTEGQRSNSAATRSRSGPIGSLPFRAGRAMRRRRHRRRADQRLGRRPIAEDEESGRDHPDELRIGERRQRRSGRELVCDDQKSVARGGERAEARHHEPDMERLGLPPNPRQDRCQKNKAGRMAAGEAGAATRDLAMVGLKPPRARSGSPAASPARRRPPPRARERPGSRLRSCRGSSARPARRRRRRLPSRRASA